MSQRGLEVFVELPSPHTGRWRYKSVAAGGIKVKQEEDEEEVQFLRKSRARLPRLHGR